MNKTTKTIDPTFRVYTVVYNPLSSWCYVFAKTWWSWWIWRVFGPVHANHVSSMVDVGDETTYDWDHGGEHLWDVGTMFGRSPLTRPCLFFLILIKTHKRPWNHLIPDSCFGNPNIRGGAPCSLELVLNIYKPQYNPFYIILQLLDRHMYHRTCPEVH